MTSIVRGDSRFVSSRVGEYSKVGEHSRVGESIRRLEGGFEVRDFERRVGEYWKVGEDSRFVTSIVRTHLMVRECFQVLEPCLIA